MILRPEKPARVVGRAKEVVPIDGTTRYTVGRCACGAISVDGAVLCLRCRKCRSVVRSITVYCHGVKVALRTLIEKEKSDEKAAALVAEAQEAPA